MLLNYPTGWQSSVLLPTSAVSRNQTGALEREFTLIEGQPHHKASGWRPAIQYSEPQVATHMSYSTVLPPKHNSRISFTLLLVLHPHIPALMFSFLLANRCSGPHNRPPTLFLRTAGNRGIDVQVTPPPQSHPKNYPVHRRQHLTSLGESVHNCSHLQVS